MRKNFIFFSLLASINGLQAADLKEVYQDALVNDQTYLQAQATFMANEEIIPQARAVLLPRLDLSGNSAKSYQTSELSGSSKTHSQPLSYGYQLTASENLFNWSAFSGYRIAKATVNQAAAAFVAAQQDLILRTAQAYFNVLQAQEMLRYAEAQRASLASQLKVAQQRYEVGLSAITTVQQAKAAYDAANAAWLASQTDLTNQQEDLQVLTNKAYDHLVPLKKNFPLKAPEPANVEAWVKTATEKNLGIQAAQYGALAAQENIGVQTGNHLPTLALQGSYGTTQTRDYLNSNGTKGTLTNTTGTVGLAANLNLYAGGGINSKIREAEAKYTAAKASLDLTYRSTLANTRKAFAGVMTGISEVEANQQAIQSNLSALDSTQAGYKVGTQTITDVLIQQQSLYQAETQYAKARFTYLITSLQLKQAAGTLSASDLFALNDWLAVTPSPATA